MLRADVDPLNYTNYYTTHLFGLWVAQAFNQPTRNTACLLQGGLAMPDREYYVGTSADMANIRTTYLAHVATVLRLAVGTRRVRNRGARPRLARVLRARRSRGPARVHRLAPWRRAGRSGARRIGAARRLAAVPALQRAERVVGPPATGVRRRSVCLLRHDALGDAEAVGPLEARRRRRRAHGRCAPPSTTTATGCRS